MEIDENRVKKTVKCYLKEYLDKNYMMPLKKFLHMDDSEKAFECAARLPWLFIDFIQDNENVFDTIEALIQEEKVPEDILDWPDYESAEYLSQYFKTALKPYCDDFIQYCLAHGDTEIPLFCVSDFRKEIHNEWLVHMTSSENIPGLHKEGFSYGVGMDELAYTPARGTTDYKYGDGYNFAFEASDADVAETSGYGDCAILFQASGVEIYHWGDNQYQVIFYGPSARNLIFLFKDNENGNWYVDSEITGYRLVEFEKLDFLVKWCISNFPQYHNHLVGWTNQRRKFERNVDKRKEQQYKKVSEGIFSKYLEK